MEETLQALMKLQESDNEIRSYLSSRDEVTERAEKLETLLSLGLVELQEKQSKLEEADHFYREKDGELKANVERAKQAKSKLSAITKQKEYLASQKELEYLKKANAAKEEEILNLMQAIDEYRRGIAADEEKLAVLKSSHEEESAANQEKLAELEKAIKKLNKKRNTVAEQVASSTLRRYERVLKGREGLAVVGVINGACCGCNMRIQPQAFIQLLKGEQLMNCPNCQRFIYPIKEEETTAEAATAS